VKLLLLVSKFTLRYINEIYFMYFKSFFKVSHAIILSQQCNALFTIGIWYFSFHP